MNIYSLTTSQVTPGEIIANGVIITIEGMLVVFFILILIMLVIYAMGLFSGKNKSKNITEASNDSPVIEETVEDVTNEEELIAVLTAAVAVCMGTSSSSVNIKSYKKISSAWGNAAKREVLDNRF